MRILLFLCSIVCFELLNAQTINVDDYLVGDEERPKILLVGTFHFGYPGVDTHKTLPEYRLDIMSDERQSELEELREYIKRFSPTKIMLEAGRNTGYLMSRMRAWQDGKSKLYRSETDQLAIRLVHELQLDTIYGIDALGIAREKYISKDSTAFLNLFDGIYKEREERPNTFEDRYWDWYDTDDSLTYNMPLLDYFKFMNSDKMIDRMHGHYVLDDKYDDYKSVDGWLLLNWFSRNLRIFKNIQNIETTSDDRILVIIGAAHVSILKHQFTASPEYELVKFNDIEKE